jgi:hypothetical protein
LATVSDAVAGGDFHCRIDRGFGLFIISSVSLSGKVLGVTERVNRTLTFEWYSRLRTFVWKYAAFAFQVSVVEFHSWDCWFAPDEIVGQINKLKPILALNAGVSACGWCARRQTWDCWSSRQIFDKAGAAASRRALT